MLPQKPAKKGYIDFLENYICGDKNITDFYYGCNNLSDPYTHVYGKIFVSASVIKKRAKNFGIKFFRAIALNETFKF